jgi:hypothetical protein
VSDPGAVRELLSRPLYQRAALALVVLGVGLVPWTLYLAIALPSRHVQDEFYDVAWAGFDVVLAAMLVLTGVGLLHTRIWVQGAAASAATLLVVDAWFDILSANGRDERLVAVLLAVLAELPTALLCVLIARDTRLALERAERLGSTRGVRERSNKERFGRR